MSELMDEYPKINALYMRDDKGRLLLGEYARPEFELLRDVEWLWTEKVDGTNIRLGYEPNCFRGNEVAYIAGRTNNAQIPPGLTDQFSTPPPVGGALVDMSGAKPLLGDDVVTEMQECSGRNIWAGMNRTSCLDCGCTIGEHPYATVPLSASTQLTTVEVPS